MADIKTEKSMTIDLTMPPLPGEEIDEEPFTFSDPVFLDNEKTNLHFANDFKVENPVKTLISASFLNDEKTNVSADGSLSSDDEIFDLDSVDSSLETPFVFAKFGENSNDVKELSISAIVEDEDGVFQVANGLKANADIIIDKSLLDLVKSVIG
ncbi:MAG: hypothetical protein HDR51_02015 [Treponema sp.]|nr:hypothetical protein [Treponema sp.]MBD5442305.1 hypothetical protein [Treponema sp.]